MKVNRKLSLEFLFFRRRVTKRKYKEVLRTEFFSEAGVVTNKAITMAKRVPKLMNTKLLVIELNTFVPTDY